jgi:hypothetical protein
MALSEQQARAQVRRKRAFYVQIGWFVIINVFLLIVNLITSPNDLWFYWITVFWLLGLLINAATIWLKKDFLGKQWEDKQVEKLTRQ